MEPLANIGVLAARAAGNYIMRNFDRVDALKIERKGKSDFVTQVDRGAEAEIVKIIRKHYPHHGILGEEGGASGTDDEVRWIIDPLDGTTNFLHALPHFAVSIGVEVRGRLEHGVVYAPATQDLYVASRGSGTTLNNKRVRVSKVKDLEDSLIGTGVPIRKPEMLDVYLPMMRRVAENTAGLRRAGAAALDLAYVASGRLDGFFEMNLKPWDIAAGIVLVQEAGGVVNGLIAGNVLDHGHVLASNNKLIGPLTDLIGTFAPTPTSAT
ncbi:MAG: inositol monophosphatase family protein [Pseudomonadota bacterium]